MSSYSQRIANLSAAKRALLEARLEARQGLVVPVAIIGLGCRFPGAANPQAFWQLLQGGGDAITEVPRDRWDVETFYDPDPAKPGKMSTRWGGFLDRVDGFDPHFFGISPREAARMDPQQRLMLEVAWEALEDAGLPVEPLAGTATGVFVGISTNDYGRMQFSDASQIDGYVGTGGAMSIAANRISYLFDLKGPSLAVDTACSSSLVAVHLACQSLWNRECTLALAGGVNLILSPEIAINFTKAGAMAPDGRCKAFDSRANGYVRGEGAGMVVLKPLSKALADGDPVYAVIRGSAVNQDGRTNGLMAPNRYSQEAVLREAYGRAGVPPGEVQYIEAHGTGTLLGDPIEAMALGAVLAQGRHQGRRCALGAVKTNIGHLEAAAGIAGLIKVVLSMRHRQIPPNLHFLEPNPHIPFATLPLEVPQQLEPWPRSEGPALAGVSSFGFGGTNAHVVLEEAPSMGPSPDLPTAEAGDVARVLALSARSPEALRELARHYREFVAGSSASLRDICYTSALRRSHHDHRLALVARSKAQVRECLDAFLAQEARPNMSAGGATSGRQRQLVFVFPGQGSQWHKMGRELLEQEPVFRSSLELCDQAMREIAGWSLLEAIRAKELPLEKIDVVQPVLFAMEVALSQVWRSWGIEPHAVVGHSMGEIAAAHFAGALTLRDALRITCWRSRLMARLSGLGAMAVVELPLDRLARSLVGYQNRLSVAASNSPASTVLSGDPAALDEVMNALQSEGIFCRLVKVDVAAHSPQLDPLRTEMLNGLAGIQSSPAAIPFYSTVRSGRVDTFDAQYWWQNMRETVQFAAAVDRLLESGHDLFVEISPHPILLTAISDSLRARGQEGTVLPSLRRDEDERATLLGSLGALYSLGWPVDWSRHYPARGSCLQLPSYPWQRERCWADIASGSDGDGFAPRLEAGTYSHPLLGHKLNLARSSGDHFWERRLNRQTVPPFVLDHRVQGAVVLPGAAYVEMALAAAVEVFGAGPWMISEMQFHKALFLPENVSRCVQAMLSTATPGEGTFQVYSRPSGHGSGEEPWVLHATGRISADSDNQSADRQKDSVEILRTRLVEEISGPEFYVSIRALGNEYGPNHQGIGHIWRSDAEALAKIQVPSEVGHDFADYQLHPALLDAVWQAFGGILGLSTSGNGSRGATVPIFVDRVKVHGRPAAKMWSHARLRTNGNAGEQVGDVDLLDETGELLVETRGLRLRPLETPSENVEDANIDGWLYEMKWRAQKRSPQKQPLAKSSKPGVWLILADSSGVGQQLAQLLTARGEMTVLVHPADAFERLDGLHYGVRPGSSEDMIQMLKSVFDESQAACRGVFHLWSLDLPPEDQSNNSILEKAQFGCGSALCLVQALARTQAGVTRLWLVTRGAQPVDGPARLALAQSPLWGLGRVISQEHPSLWGGLIDLDPAFTAPESAAEVLIEADDSQGEDQIAYRRGTRFVARLERKDRAAGRRVVRWRSDASYLITGGLGDLGLVVARWLVDQGARQLILLSRTKLPPREQWGAQVNGTRVARQLSAIQELEVKGAKVLAASVDVANEEQFASFLRQYRQDGFGPIAGVVHAAGLVDLKPLVELDPAALQAILRPKIVGTWLLHRLLRDNPLDFFVLFSSFASLLSSPQLGAYAAANAFLDALAHHRQAEDRPALAINWAVWSDVGMAARYFQSAHAMLRGVESFTPAQGLTVLGRLLEQDSAQVGVMRVNWRTWRLLYPTFSQSPLLSQLIREGTDQVTEIERQNARGIRESLLAAEPGNRLQILETYLREQAARVLRLSVSKLDIQRSFTMLGFDSLMAVELRNRVEADLGIALPLVDLLQGPSVAQLSSKLLEQVMASSLLSSDRDRLAEPPAESDWEILKL
jgi:myxalamid-type polyketide synthase MxaE and MxaD